MREFLAHILELVEPLNHLIQPIQPVLSFIASILGLGTFAFIALLHWALGNLRDQAKERERKLKELEKELKYVSDLAEERKQKPDELRVEIEKLKQIINTSGDDSRREAAMLGEKLTAMTAKVGGALSATAYGNSLAEDAQVFWARARRRWESYTQDLANSIPICFFGSQKGGVGKSMTATNLAASFAERGERVLIIDLDYQGSSSSMLRTRGPQT